MPQTAFSPTKGGMTESYPIVLQCWLPFLSGASSELLSMDLFLATLWAVSLLPLAALSASLMPAFSLSRAFFCAAFYNME